jgi:phosphoglycerate dehydrogenase-like enzyme
LKFLAIPAVGANFFVNMEDAKTHGVTVMNCPGYNSEAVAEMAIGSAIAVSRKVPLLQKDLRSGVWDESSRGQSLLLSGKKIGIIGHGNVGKNIASKLSTWNVEIEFVDSSTNSDEIDRIIRESDSIFVCCPLNEDTKNLINKKRINSMKSTAVVVNVGRGAVIDEDALYRALKDKKIHGAGIDVFNDEPEYGESLPESIARFIALDNVYATPHLAGSSLESSHTLGLMIYENLKSVSSGSPINVYS